jgi:PAS domain S-box-containing protein
MKTKMEQFPATNPNPLLRVEKDGTVLYSNKAGEPLLHEWDVGVGEKLPSSIGDFVQRVLSRNSPEKMEVKAGKRVYLIVFHPLSEEKCVCISGFDLSYQKEFEDNLRGSEVREAANLELAEVVDIQAIQSLMEDFYKITHIPMGLNDLKGNVLGGAGWQDICTKFHRVHPEACKHCVESNIKLSVGVAPGEFKLFRCKNNMWDIATPIMMRDQQVGILFSGQFFFEDESLDYELFRSQAKQYGFNEEEYMAALEKVPRLSRETVDTGMAFLTKLANMLSQLSYSNIKLAQSLAERESLVDALQESEKRERVRSDELAVVLDAVPVAVYIAHDPQALQITGNRLSYEWQRITVGTNLSKSTLEGERPEMFSLFKDGVEIPPADMPSQMSAAGIEINNCELDIISADGERRHVLGNARPLRDEQGNLRGSISAFIDITERKKAEAKLKETLDNLEKLVEERTTQFEKAYKSSKESEKGLAEAQKMAHIGNWVWDIATDTVHWSDELYRIFKRDTQEAAPPYIEYLSYVHPDDRDYVDNAFKGTINGKPYNIEHRIILANRDERTVLIQAEVVFDEKNIPIRVKGIVQDITERKRAEEKIEILANAVESSNDAIITESLDGIITSWNKEAEHIYGYSAEEILGKDTSILEPDNLKGEIKKLIDRIKQGIKIKNYETTRLKKDGTLIDVSLTLSPVFDISGKLTAVSIIGRDITERIKAEKSLAKAEAARKKEIHHRIKNNLQVISSLLDLQADKFEDENVREAFRESQSRVVSMALIHEELYKEEGTDTLNFSEYLKKLAESLFQTYRLSSKNIHLNMDLEENTLFDMDTAVPLGIIVNELVSNSLKHAFPGRDKGEIRIELRREENGEYKKEGCKRTSFALIVSDNGVGIPENLDIEDLDSLGLQLVITLVDQLEGELELKRNNGTEFTMRFIVIEKNKQASAPSPQQLIE